MEELNKLLLEIEVPKKWELSNSQLKEYWDHVEFLIKNKIEGIEG